MLVATNLTRKFGPTLAVDDVSFAVARGEIVGFLGPNGAGKTTTIQMLAGVLTPDQGKVEIDGHDPNREMEAVRQSLGYLPEGAPSFSALTPIQSLRCILGFANWPKAKRDARTAQVLDQLELTSRANTRIDTLSKGFQRRTALALALATDPPVLLLDEPFDGFDPVQKKAGRALLKNLAKDKAILICTHSLGEAKDLCDRILILNRGQLVAKGSVEELLATSGQSTFEQAFCQIVGAG